MHTPTPIPIPTLMPTPTRRPAPPLDMPLVWQPAMAPGHAPPPKPSHARKPSKPPPSHAHGDDGEEGPADVIGCVPRDRMRGVFEAPAGGQPGAASWFQVGERERERDVGRN